jgi:hypothetical protein
VARLDVRRVLLPVRHLVALQVHAGARAVDVLLERVAFKGFDDGRHLGALAPVDVVHRLKPAAFERRFHGFKVHAVALDVLDRGLERGVVAVGLSRELRRDGLLAAGEERDLVPLLHELAREVDADEAGAAHHEDLLGGGGGGLGADGDGGAGAGGAAGD